jgi:uncharacterized protein (DUF1697 family)
MTRCFAFLRAVNVGGYHAVAMERLRELFHSFGFSGVETFLASGNVIFDAEAGHAAELEPVIEAGLRKSLGYDVATFLRTEAELRAVAGFVPFSESRLVQAAALNVAFLKEVPGEERVRRLFALRTEIDDFRVHGREVYWSCLRKQSDSKFSNAALEKALGQPSTLRGVATVRKMTEKYAP